MTKITQKSTVKECLTVHPIKWRDYVTTLSSTFYERKIKNGLQSEKILHFFYRIVTIPAGTCILKCIYPKQRGMLYSEDEDILGWFDTVQEAQEYTQKELDNLFNKFKGN